MQSQPQSNSGGSSRSGNGSGGSTPALDASGTAAAIAAAASRLALDNTVAALLANGALSGEGLAGVLQLVQGCIGALETKFQHSAATSSSKISSLEQELSLQRESFSNMVRQLEGETRRLETKIRRLEGDVLRNSTALQASGAAGAGGVANGGPQSGGGSRADSPANIPASSKQTPEQFIRIMRDYHVRECPQSQRGISHDWSQCDPLLVHRAPGRPLPLRRDPRKTMQAQLNLGETSPWTYAPSDVDSRSPEFM